MREQQSKSRSDVEALRLAKILETEATHSITIDLEAAAELRRLHQSEREGWRYAAELEQSRKELLEALDLLIGAIEQHCMSDDQDVKKELDVARAAIAKAEGKEHA